MYAGQLSDAFVKNRKNKICQVDQQVAVKRTGSIQRLCPSFCPTYSQEVQKQLQTVNVEHHVRSDSPLSSLGTNEQSSTPGIAIQVSISVSPAPSLGAPTTSEKRERPSTSVAQGSGHVDIGERLMSLLQEPVPKPHMPDAELYEPYHFALSLVPMLQRLDKDSRQQAKIEILYTLHNIEKGQIVTPQQAAGLHPPTQDILGHSSHNTRPADFQPVTLPQQSTHWEDESIEGCYNRDL